MLRVAFTTTDGMVVGDHFGRCGRFDVYDLSPRRAELVASRTPVSADDSSGRIDARLNLLRDCAILHIASIGGPAAAKVINAGIHPLKVPEDTAIAALTARLQAVLTATPPPWLRKVLRQHDPDSVAAWSP